MDIFVYLSSIKDGLGDFKELVVNQAIKNPVAAIALSIFPLFALVFIWGAKKLYGIYNVKPIDLKSPTLSSNQTTSTGLKGGAAPATPNSQTAGKTDKVSQSLLQSGAKAATLLIPTVSTCVLTALNYLTAIDPSVNKICMGTISVATGASGIVQSRIFDLIGNKSSEETSNNTTNYMVAGLSSLGIAAGIYMIATGASELYYGTRLPVPPIDLNNMCQTTPEICKGNLGVPRKGVMPQIGKDAVDNFFEYFKNLGSNITYIKLPARSLFPTQNELDAANVNQMVEAAKAGTFDPCNARIIASGVDYHILDGHHRWAACHILGKEISVASISTSIHDLLEGAKKVAGVTYL